MVFQANEVGLRYNKPVYFFPRNGIIIPTANEVERV